MIRLLTIIGARPQIIKAAAISRAISMHFADKIEEYILHTGQHYDQNMSAVFFDELGTPCLRFNDFVGQKKISVLEELEHVYHLTNGIHSSDADTLYKRIDEILTLSDARPIYLENRQRMLKDKIDVTKYWTWFIENYPQSAVQHEEKSPFWGQFK